MNFKIFACFVILISAFSSSSFSQIKSINTEALVKLMEGSFSSEEQSKNDSDFYDIRLHMKRIWPEFSSAYWLYAEQAMADSQDKPYRQRVYRITNTNEGRFESTVYTFPDPLRFAGDWKSENPLSGLTPDSLTIREGCSVTLTMMAEDVYTGGTTGKDCQSDLRGAKYATSEVTVTKSGLITWDRGFDEDGKQVWGSVKGGYMFKRTD